MLQRAASNARAGRRGLAAPLLTLALASACEHPETPPAPRVADSSASPRFARPSADPAVLREHLERAPSPLGPTSPEGGLVGTDTGLEGDATALPIQPPVPPGPDIAMEPVTKLSSASTEKALRASLYAELVLRCRATDGSVLPPDAVAVKFAVAPDGHIDRSRISSKAADPRHDDAARCMLRVLRTSDVRIPAGHGETTLVSATVPSVD